MPRSTLREARLYGIVDLGYLAPDDLVPSTRTMLAGGIDAIQLRAKDATHEEILAWSGDLLPLCRDAGVPFIVNGSPRIAAEIGADGVHVGQDDGTMDEVRAIVGEDMLVGRSTHSVDQAAAAAGESRTDYIGFGPLFATPTKPGRPAIGLEAIRSVYEAHPDLPVFCIGGIKRENLSTVIAAGARQVVIVSGILQAPDIAAYVAEAKTNFT